MQAADANVFIPQFTNKANPAMHEQMRRKEIWEAVDGRLAAFVAGVGTGGTVTGVGRGLKAHDAAIRIVAVEQPHRRCPAGTAEFYAIQGIGANFVPEVLNGMCMMKC